MSSESTRGRLLRAACESLAVGFVVAASLLFVLPLQTFLSQGDLFGCSVGFFLKSCLPVFLTGFGCVALAVFAGRIFCGTWVYLIGLVCVVWAILESGVLSIGLPELNGSFEGYGILARAIADCVVWLLALVAMIKFRKVITRHVISISLLMAAWTFCSVFDVRRPACQTVSGLAVPTLMPRTDVVSSAIFSSEDNVLLLVLDSVTADVAASIFAEDPELRRQYVGFECYTNNLSMQWYTALAMPAIMTGKFLSSANESHEYGLSTYKESSFFVDYLNLDIPVYVNVALGDLGYTNRMRRKNLSGKISTNPLFLRMSGTFNWTVFELCGFRVVPYCMKTAYVKALLRKWAVCEQCPDVFSDGVLWPELALAPVTKEEKSTLHVHHTRGGHAPYRFKADGSPNSEMNIQNAAAYKEQTTFALRQVGKFLDALRAKGIYRNATIFVIADHGYPVGSERPRYAGLPKEASALMLVKVPGDESPFRMSGKKTSHAGIAPIMRRLARERLTRDEIERQLCVTPRFCRKIAGLTVTEYQVQNDDSVIKRNITGREPEENELVALSTGVDYAFSMSDLVRSYPSFRLENGSRSGIYGVSPTANPMRLSVKAPKPLQLYNVSFVVAMRKRDAMVYRDSMQSIKFENTGDSWKEVVLCGKPVMSDSKGILRFSFSNANGNDVLVIRRMKIVPAKAGVVNKG